jgi:hypothetical protein
MLNYIDTTKDAHIRILTLTEIMPSYFSKKKGNDYKFIDYKINNKTRMKIYYL